GPALVHGDQIWGVDFHPRDHVLATASMDRTVNLWHVAPPIAGEQERVCLWVELLTGVRLEKDGAFAVLDQSAYEERRQRLEALGGAPAGTPAEPALPDPGYAQQERHRRYAAKLRSALASWQDGKTERAQADLDSLAPVQGQKDPRGFEWHFLRGQI